MSQPEVLIDKETARQFFGAVRRFAASPVGGKAKLMFLGLLALLLGVNAMSVVNNYVGRDFMTAIENRDRAGFAHLAWLYLLVFAASTVVSVFAKVLEDRLGLLWREFITRQAVRLYLEAGTYYRLDNSGELQNPDQRIAEDVRVFTVTTLSFAVIILNSLLTIIAFSGVVLSISPLLFLVAVAYAAGGSYLAFRLGRPLVDLNYAQLDKDANFRSTLLHVRENAEPLLLAHREGRLKQRLLARFEEVACNLRKIINVNRNLGFFTGGYYWLIGLIPALIVAPDFMAGEVAFGVVTQSAMAFSTLVGAFSLVVTQFQSISNFAAVLSRLEDLGDAIMERPSKAAAPIRLDLGQERLAYEGLSLLAPADGERLLEGLSVSLPPGARVLVSGPNEAAKVALFKATAGLAVEGRGRILRPSSEEMLFLAERPYLPPGTLREILAPVSLQARIPDGTLAGLLGELGAEAVLERAGGLDEERDWDSALSLAEQQLLAFIHVLLREPRFVFLDRTETALSREQFHRVLAALSSRSIGYLAIAEDTGTPDCYDAVLDISGDGGWTWTELRPAAGGGQP